jgi:hypothetical protein
MRIPWRRHKNAAVTLLTTLGGVSRQEAADRVANNGALLDDIAAGVPMDEALRRLVARREAQGGPS